MILPSGTIIRLSRAIHTRDRDLIVARDCPIRSSSGFRVQQLFP